MRIPTRHLEHTVTVQAILPVGSSVGALHGEPVTRRAIVVDKRSKVVDQRVDSETKGAEVISSSHVLVQPEHYAAPGSLVTVWPGTVMERTGEVIATAYAQHSKAPSSAQMWLA